MRKEEYDNILNEIRTTEDSGRRSELLQLLDNDYTTMLATEQSNKETIEKITKENETLAKANNSLWLERSSATPKNDSSSDNSESEEHEEQIDISKLDFD